MMTHRNLPKAGAIALMAALAVLPVTARAERGPGMRGPGMHGASLGFLAHRLDLGEEQREAIRGVFESHRDEIRTQMEAARPARDALREAIQSDVFDEGAIRSAAAAVAALEAESAVLRGRIFQEAFALLTPEQQTEARALLDEPRGAMHRRGPRRGGRAFRSGADQR